jgi:hypothetical protein
MAIQPILAKYDYEAERWIWGLSPEDFFKIQNGYACSRCLEEWKFWVAACPVCGEVNVPLSEDAPKEWKGR